MTYLGGITDEPFAVGESDHHARGRLVALVVGNDLDLAILVDANARIRRAQINTDCSS